jgi:hypothetical protein
MPLSVMPADTHNPSIFEATMSTMIPAGVVPLDDAELDLIVGGTIWRTIAAAAAFGFTVGRWLACAVQCIAFE